MPGPLKIVITTGIFPPDIGGPATYVPLVAAGLAGGGHQVTVVTASDTLDHPADADYPFRLIRIPRGMPKPARWARTVSTIAREARAADVVLANGFAMEATLATRMGSTPLVHKVVGDMAWERSTVNGWTSDPYEVFQATRYGPRIEGLKALRAWWVRQADRVIANSAYTAGGVERWGVPRHKVQVVYNATASLSGTAPAPVPLDTPVKLVTAVRLVPWKHVDEIMEAMAPLDGVGFVVVGDGPERSALEAAAAAAGLAGRVYFAGQCSKGQTAALMAACDVFVLNSSWESFPHAALEAMSLGLPVVATDVPGTDEIVRDGENGRLVRPRDVAALRGALAALAGSAAERERMRPAALATAERFGVERMVADTAALLRAVAEGGRRPEAAASAR